MKKLFVFLAAVLAFTACACRGPSDKRYADIRDGYYEAADEYFIIKAVSGRREEPYIMDGTSNPLIEYTLITVEPKSYTQGKTYGYRIQADNNEFTGSFTAHPFAQSYSAELPVRIDCAQFSISVLDGTAVYPYTATSFVTSDMISYERAAELAYGRLRESVKGLGEYEIYARLMKNPLTGEGLCWYVSFLGQSATYSVLINPVTCKLEAVRE